MRPFILFHAVLECLSRKSAAETLAIRAGAAALFPKLCLEKRSHSFAVFPSFVIAIISRERKDRKKVARKI